jgi:hypothetical protein
MNGLELQVLIVVAGVPDGRHTVTMPAPSSSTT